MAAERTKLLKEGFSAEEVESANEEVVHRRDEIENSRISYWDKYPWH